MYIHEIALRNYSIHKETRITLSPITVLVGPNGAGKSALFNGLLNFSMLSRGNIGQAFGQYPYSYHATRYRGASSISRIGFDVVMGITKDAPEKLRYRIDYSQRESAVSGVAAFEIHTERLESVADNRTLFDREDPDASTLTQAIPFVTGDTGIFAAIRKAALGTPDLSFPPVVIECAKQISRFNKFRLDPHNLSAPSFLPDLSAAETPRIDYEGENVAGALYFLHETAHPSLDTIRESVRQALPGFDDFEFNTVGTQRIGFSMRFTDQRQTIPAPRLSDGQLLVVGLMVLVHTDNRPPILLIEEPENGLTATVQRVFYNSVRQLAFANATNASTQVLISSHSPFILCEAWNGEDRDFIHQVKVEDGRAVVRKFSDAIAAQGIQLARDAEGKRTQLSLKTAEEVMSGYLS